jgi:hypothetical protein
MGAKSIRIQVMTVRYLLLGLIGAIVCGTCGPPLQAPTATATSTIPASLTPFSTQLPTATSRPEIPLEVGAISLVQDPQERTWSVMGMLENQSELALGDIELHLRARDADGNLLLEMAASPALSAVPPGAEIPFIIQLDKTARPESVEVTPAQWHEVELDSANLSVRITGTFSSGDRDFALGVIRNPGTTAALLRDLVLASRAGDAGPSGFGRMMAGPSVLPPNDEAPFLAELISAGEIGALTPYYLAEMIRPSPPRTVIAMTKQPEVRQDPQGNPFVIGEFTNQGETSAWLSATLGFRLDDEWVLALEVNHPLPLAPGESRAFSGTDLHGLRKRLAEEQRSPGEVEIEIWMHPLKASAPAPSTAPLQIEIRTYVVIGSSIFMRGTISNAQTVELYNPTVNATILDTRGRIISAAWHNLTHALAPGASDEFLLHLPLGPSENPTTFEPHVWAAGLLEPPSAE